MAKVRAKNTATAKDMMGCFVLWSREIDVESFRLSEQQVIEGRLPSRSRDLQELGLELLAERVFSLCTNFHTAGFNFFPLEQLWILLRANLNALQIFLEIALASSTPIRPCCTSFCPGLTVFSRISEKSLSSWTVEEEVALKRKLEFGAPSKTEDESLLDMQRATPMQRAWMPMLP